MSDYSTHWTKNDLSAYLLLYCAHADFIETSEELEMVKSKVNRNEYERIHREFEADNDFQSIQKIQHTVHRLDLSNEQLEEMVAEMKDLFFADGHFEAAEQAVFVGLRHILKNEEE